VVTWSRGLTRIEFRSADTTDLTCEVCGYVNTADRAYYWGTCSECASIKGEHKATPLPAVGRWATGEVES
jgi:hypothetical protein